MMKVEQKLLKKVSIFTTSQASSEYRIGEQPTTNATGYQLFAIYNLLGGRLHVLINSTLKNTRLKSVKKD